MIDHRLPREGYGYGIIRMDCDLASRLVSSARIDETTTQGELKAQGALEQCKQVLLLPEDYEVLGIYLRYYHFTWDVFVEAPGLPMPVPGEELPSVVPIYESTYTPTDKYGVTRKAVKLVRIEVAKHHYEILRVD